MKNIINNEKSSNTRKYLNFEERPGYSGVKMIEKMIKECLSLRKIGRVLGRGKSTIGDEIKNNSTFYDGYKPELAHKKFLRNQFLKKNKVSIHKRPEKINKRKRIGDFESNSVIFPNQKQVLNVNVDRRTRLLRFELVKDKTALSSIAVQKKIVYEFEEYGIDIYFYTSGFKNPYFQVEKARRGLVYRYIKL